MTKRSACRHQLLNEVEGAEDAGTSRAFAGSAPPTSPHRYDCGFSLWALPLADCVVATREVCAAHFHALSIALIKWRRLMELRRF
jgi:phosphatidylethanolamine-binding protein (PEBP) family uncharacterized protein